MSGTKNEEHFKHELFEILNITAESLNNWELLQGSYYGNFLNSFKLEIQDANNVEIQNEFNEVFQPWARTTLLRFRAFSFYESFIL
jgi:hypothetical protein